jgi:hypothetical protein
MYFYLYNRGGKEYNRYTKLGCCVEDFSNLCHWSGLCNNNDELYIKIIISPCVNTRNPNQSLFDKYVFSDEYYLYSVKAIKKFRLQITPIYIMNTCKYGHIDVLDLCYNNYRNLFDKLGWNIMDFASLNGRVNVLEWWLKSGLELKYSEKALEYASEYGHIHVLEWWLKSKLPLKYSDKLIDLVLHYNKIDVLCWWYESGLPLKYSKKALNIIRSKKYSTFRFFSFF